MKNIRVRVEDYIYKRLKETLLKYKSWNDIVNEALSLLLQKYEKDPLEKMKATIVEHYYEAKSVKRIFAMLESLNRDWIRISSKLNWESDPVLVRLVAELGEVIKKMKERLEELDKEELERMKNKVESSEST